MKNLILILLFKFILMSEIYSFENKIVLKIENEIITTIDVENEIAYLSALNPNIKNLKLNELKKIAKNSLVREKIKKNELFKYLDEIKLDPKFLNKLIKERYSRLNLNNKEEFLNYLDKNNLNIKVIENKISVEALWNQLIYQKFSSNVIINKNKLEKQIEDNFNIGEKSYLLSEIVFKLENKKNLDKKFFEIKDSISKVGFENAALTYSNSDSVDLGGKLGWIKESTLNKIILDNIKNLKINDISKPIFTTNGYIILKIDDIKFVQKKFDKNKELDNLIKFETNKQLNQYSNIYFNKVKKNTNINEL